MYAPSQLLSLWGSEVCIEIHLQSIYLQTRNITDIEREHKRVKEPGYEPTQRVENDTSEKIHSCIWWATVIR
jgi:hypothetical protein